MTTTTVKTETAIHARDVGLAFGPTRALIGVDVDVQVGEIVALMGPSGSGKSTLLHCLAGILRPDSGQVTVAGHRLDRLSEKQRSALRLHHMGFVFQFGDLVPELTLAENVALPLQLTGTKAKAADAASHDMLDSLGLADSAGRRAGAVSGGQAQRAAVARALIHRPQVVFADEPTGALDSVSGEQVLDLLVRTARDAGASVLIVTHDNRVAAHADRLVTMRDGLIVGADR